jgi:D-alanyl-D-alanine carboxypeptidase
MRKQLVILALIIAALVGINALGKRADEQTGTDGSSKSQAAAKFDKSKLSLTDPTSAWVVVNKRRPINPKPYIPTDLGVPNVSLRLPHTSPSMQMRTEAAVGLEKLFAAAQANGTPLRLSSAYRSYNYQVSLYAGYVEKDGQGAADSESARPGYSEHQTGLAADVGNSNGACEVQQCFGDSAAGKWVASQSYKYGYIVRYPQGLTAVTGYEYEPWHLRYVGVSLATEMHRQNVQTLEQFFALGDAPNYE